MLCLKNGFSYRLIKHKNIPRVWEFPRSGCLLFMDIRSGKTGLIKSVITASDEMNAGTVIYKSEGSYPDGLNNKRSERFLR